MPINVISQFVPTEIDLTRLRQFSTSFERAIESRLKCRNPKTVVHVDFDVFRYVFGESSVVLCNIEDFSKLSLPDHWFYCLRKDGTGRKLKFPVKVTIRLCIRKMFVVCDGRLVQKDVPVERCSIYSCTEACTIEDLN